MREHDTLQAAMRFGRDANGAVVYVHTATLPDWVPIAGEGRVVATWSDGMRQVLEAAAAHRNWTTADLAAHPTVEISQRQVFSHLESLAERGVLERDANPADARGYVWRADGLYRLGDHGEVELDTVSVASLSETAVAEVARMSTYTWKFRNRGGFRPDRRSYRATDPANSAIRNRTDTSSGERPPP
jgi:hypothetical protein